VTDTAAGIKSFPTGTVSWSSSAPGTFVPAPTCVLVPTLTTGVANCSVSYTANSAGPRTITATYDGDLAHNGSSGTAMVTVTPAAPAIVTVTPPTATNTVGTQHCVTATITDRFGNPIPSVKVLFSVTGVNAAIGSAVTNAAGQAGFCYTGQLFGVDTIRAVADANGNNNADVAEPFGEATKEWLLPLSSPLCVVDFGTYGGWITAANGDKANFGGNVHVSELLIATGQEEYQDKGPMQPMNVHSINVLAVLCTTITGGMQASIYGRATIDGAGSYPYRITVKDMGEPGTNDTYSILLSNGYYSGEQKLAGGNVQIHSGGSLVQIQTGASGLLALLQPQRYQSDDVRIDSSPWPGRPGRDSPQRSEVADERRVARFGSINS
jgi:hypothetical protein